MKEIEAKLEEATVISTAQFAWFVVRTLLMMAVVLYMYRETGSKALVWFSVFMWAVNEYRASALNLAVRKNNIMTGYINTLTADAQEMRNSYDEIAIRFKNVAAETQALRTGLALGVLHNKLCGVVSPEMLAHTYNASGVAEIMKEAAAAVAQHERDMMREAERIIKKNGGVQ